MSLTIGKGCKRSIGLFLVSGGKGRCKPKPKYVIPGAECFLDFDLKSKSIRYLTTMKMADLTDNKVDVRDARLSSLSQVKEISFDQIKELKSLIKEAGVIMHDISEFELTNH